MGHFKNVIWSNKNIREAIDNQNNVANNMLNLNANPVRADGPAPDALMPNFDIDASDWIL